MPRATTTSDVFNAIAEPRRRQIVDLLAVRGAVEAHGRLQVLVNNAGVGHVAPLAQMTDAAWDEVMGTNLAAVFRLTRAALPSLSNGGGHVFMISSLAGSNPIAGMSAYCASKAALDQLSRCLMLEVRHAGVKITVLAPGSVDTSFGGRQTRDAWKLQPDDLWFAGAQDSGVVFRFDGKALHRLAFPTTN